MKVKVLLLFCLFLSGCSKKPEVSFQGYEGKLNEVKTSMATVNTLQVVNDQLVIQGTRLDGVQSIKITGPNSFNESFSIESINANQIVANGLKNIAFAVGKVFSLIISDAHGASTFSVTFTLQDGAVTANKIADGAVTAAKLADMGAANGDALIYNSVSGLWEAKPLSGLDFKGTWNASTNTPTLSDGGGSTFPGAGDYYVVDTAGSTGLDTISTWNSGDWVIYNGSTWDRIVNSSTITSFNGRQGAVIPQAGDYSIEDLSNVDTTGAALNSVLKFDGSNWVVGVDDDSGVAVNSVDSSSIQDGTIGDSDLAGGIDQSKITNLSADLAGKLSLGGGTMTGDITFNSTQTFDGVDVSNLKTQADLNTSNITTNTTNISSNTTALGSKVDTSTTVNGQALSSNIILDSDDISEGSTNFYFTDARAKTASVVNSTAGSETDQAPSVSSIKSYIATQITGSGDVKSDGTVAMSADFDFGNNKAKFKSDNTNYVELIAPNTLGATYTLTLPGDDGTLNQVLTTDGSGNLSWSAQTTDSDTTYTAGTGLTLSTTTFNVDVGTSANKIVQLDGTGKLPAIDGSQLTNLPSSGTSSVLSGFVTGADATVANTDTVEEAFEKLQGQVDGNNTDIAAREPSITAGTTAQYYRGDKSWQALDATAVGLGNVTNDAQIPLANRDNGALSTSTTNVPTSNAVKTYVDAQVSGASSQWTTTGSDIYYNTGDVGIGTSSPARSLHVLNNSQSVLARVESSNTFGSSIELHNTDTGGRNWSISSSGSANTGGAGDFLVYDQSGGAERLVIEGTTGNVGVGTSSPASKLEVNGVIHSTSGGIKFPDGTTQTTAGGGGGSSTLTLETKTATYNVVSGDNGKVFLASNAITYNLPSASSAGSGFQVQFKRLGNNAITIDANGAETIDEKSVQVLGSKFATAHIVSDGTNWVILNSTGSVGSCVAPPETFAFTGANQSTTVPSGCTKMIVKAWGAGGGGGYHDKPGGAGGFTHASVPVTGGTTIAVLVGQGGDKASSTTPAGETPGYGLGGLPYGGVACSVGHGGGLSGVFETSISQPNALVIAGGGGGGSGAGTGGYGGNDPTYSGGETGMTGIDGTSTYDAGGGGGYNGGSAATNQNSTHPPGRGGSGYVHASGTLVLSSSTAIGTRTAPENLDTDYPGGSVGFGGEGNPSTTYSCSNQAQAGNGYVVISWEQ